MEKRMISKTGIPVYSYANPAQHSFFISLFVRAGSMCEDKSGISHFFEHLAIRNINYGMDGALYAILDKYGLEFNASTSSEMIQFYLTGATRHFKLGADIITRVLGELKLPRGEIDR